MTKTLTLSDWEFRTARQVDAEIRYAEAKRLVRENRDLVLLRYYNTYSRSQTLKIFWMGTWVGDDSKKPKQRRRVLNLHKKLSALADYVNVGERGGEIYGFTVR